MPNDTDAFVSLILVGSVVIMLGILLFIFKVAMPFRKKRDYIKMELHRSFDKEEYLYWERELKRLYLSYIPIVGKLLLKFFNT